MLQNALDSAAARQESSQSAPAAQAFSELRPQGRGAGGARGRPAEEGGRFGRLLRQVQGGQAGQAPVRSAALQGRSKLLGSLGEEELGRLGNRLKVRLAGGPPGEGAKTAGGADGPARVKTAAPSGEPERSTAKRRRTGKPKTRPELLADPVGSAALRKSDAAVSRELRAAGDGDRQAAGAGSIGSGVRDAASARAGRARVVVLDLRKEQSKADPATAERPGRSGMTAPAFPRTVEGPERDSSVLYRGPATDKPGSSVAETARNQQLQQTFQERFLPEALKQTGIILKDGGAGEIRLVLKPDNLGSVRIRLALSESSLEGRIVVDNNSVKELVESSLDNLRNALRQEGYQTASLQVFVGNRRTSDGEARQQADSAPALGKVGAQEFERAVPLFLELKPDYGLVNLMV